MQYWFYSAEVWKEGDLIRRVSGTYPDEQFAQSLSSIVDFNNPKEVMDNLSGFLSELDPEKIVYFNAFNRV
ncbi:hypothetical protein QL189_08765 [Cronobacter turicensis]|uniref:hypothetical protein n=1 Tax=Cronobacter TaxID=413496 RepID=UPI0024A8E86F|nr:MULTISPECIES: hypothetical protein [Cronobacter]MDI6417472.1 hypothetical protein [Cronobacter turicensis]MDI6463969.1 hypothetical protein [Cronobacter turicensis]MDI7673266.1 hypothetical protein [Cronobacter turicensis]MDT3665428.1 hypothetical protein [Cronobacter dublinensis]